MHYKRKQFESAEEFDEWVSEKEMKNKTTEQLLREYNIQAENRQKERELENLVCCLAIIAVVMVIIVVAVVIIGGL